MLSIFGERREGPQWTPQEIRQKTTRDGRKREGARRLPGLKEGRQTTTTENRRLAKQQRGLKLNSPPWKQNNPATGLGEERGESGRWLT